METCCWETEEARESGQKRWSGRVCGVFFLFLGASDELASSIGCRIRLRAFMNLRNQGGSFNPSDIRHNRNVSWTCDPGFIQYLNKAAYLYWCCMTLIEFVTNRRIFKPHPEVRKIPFGHLIRAAIFQCGDLFMFLSRKQHGWEPHKPDTTALSLMCSRDCYKLILT